MDQFLPILVIAVVLIVNAIQARKKKLLEEQEKHQIPEHKQTAPPFQRRTSRSTPETGKTFSSAAAMKEEFRTKNSLNSSPEDTRERKAPPPRTKRPSEVSIPEEDNYSINAVEEARRAIIYSEIINRKY